LDSLVVVLLGLLETVTVVVYDSAVQASVNVVGVELQCRRIVLLGLTNLTRLAVLHGALEVALGVVRIFLDLLCESADAILVWQLTAFLLLQLLGLFSVTMKVLIDSLANALDKTVPLLIELRYGCEQLLLVLKLVVLLEGIAVQRHLSACNPGELPAVQPIAYLGHVMSQP